MKSIKESLILSFVLFALPWTIQAQNVPYTDEGAFLRALSEKGLLAIHESFENDDVWGPARSTIAGGFYSVPSVTHLEITWTSTSENNQITTGQGPARTGLWGFYSLPHGDYENGIGDGFAGSSARPLVAIGGWIDTNTPIAKLSLFLDGDMANTADFGDQDFLSGASRFFGVINESGFSRFDFREVEGKAEDAKFIFADDFTFAFGGSIVDCNQNGVSDALDISQGTSTDCNLNLLPDECEIDDSSSAPGGPFFCAEGCDPDCNQNGVLDACEALSPRRYSSGELSPIGAGFPQTFTLTAPATSRADVVLDLTAAANLGGFSDYLTIQVNGIEVGTVFGPNGNDCPEGAPDAATIVIPMETYNDAVGDGDANIEMIASAEVAHDECDLPTYVTLDVTLFEPSDLDLNGDGILDECETSGPSFVRGDSSGDGQHDISDPVVILFQLFVDGAATTCEKSADANDSGFVDLSDPVYLLNYLFRGGPPPEPPFPACGIDLTVDDLTCDSFQACEAP